MIPDDGMARATLIVRRAQKIRELEQYWFWESQPYQRPFDDCIAPRVLIHGGNRSGKTMHIVRRALKILSGEDEICKAKGWKPPVYLRVCGAGMHEQVLKVLVEWFRKMMPREWCTGHEFRYNEQTGLIRTDEASICKGGWIEFMSYDQDPDKGSGRPLHGVILDEAYKCSERFRNQCLARLLDYHGFAWAIETPEEGDATWSVRWYEHAKSGDPDYAVFRYPTRQNKYLYPDRDISKPSPAIEQIVKDCEGDEVLIRIRLDGDFVSIGGIVYPALNEKIHRKRGGEIGVDGSWINAIDVDPKVGVSHEHCVTWHCEGPGESLHFYRELYCKGTMEDMMIEVRRAGGAEQLAAINFDPHWDWDNQLVKKPGKEEPFNLYQSLLDAKDAAGYRDVPVVEARRDKHVWFGIDQVTAMLRPPRPGTHPQITISPECQRLWDEMRRYSCVRSREKDPTRYRPRIRKIDDDGPDCVRIAVTSPRVYATGYSLPQIIDSKIDVGYGLTY